VKIAKDQAIHDNQTKEKTAQQKDATRMANDGVGAGGREMSCSQLLVKEEKG
jgi:hypothetical protein